MQSCNASIIKQIFTRSRYYYIKHVKKFSDEPARYLFIILGLTRDVPGDHL